MCTKEAPNLTMQKIQSNFKKIELSLENKHNSVKQEQQPSTAFLLLKAFSLIRSKLCYKTLKQNH